MVVCARRRWLLPDKIWRLPHSDERVTEELERQTGVPTTLALASDLPTHLVLALQLLGSNAGNMVCVANVVAAVSVVKLVGREGDVIRLTLAPALIYCTGLGVLGWMMITLGWFG